MATPTYTPIASITLGSSASSVTFSSIPQTYRDLVLVSNQLSDSASGDGSIEYNGSTSAYSRVFMFGNGSSTLSVADSAGQIITPRSTPGVLKVQIMDYSATDKHKTTLLQSQVGNSISYTQASRYASTSAITSIKVISNGNWVTGSTFALYGIEA